MARENRAAKEKAAAGKSKGKGSQKRKCAAREADIAELKAKVVRTSKGRKAAKDPVVPWTAPVARMY